MSVVWEPNLVPSELVSLTRSLGRPERGLAILAEGNTSQRLPDGRLVVKTSGSSLATADAEDFVVVEPDPVLELLRSPSATQADLTAALDAGDHGGRRRRASIETPVHVAAQAFAANAFVAHTHPTAVVGLLASVHAAEAFDRHVYSDEAVVLGRPLYVPYASPGLDLGRSYYRSLQRYVDEEGALPTLVLLGNHGIVVNAPSAAGAEAASDMAVKGALVRTAAYSIGGVAPLPEGSVEVFFGRADIAERRTRLSEGR